MRSDPGSSNFQLSTSGQSTYPDKLTAQSWVLVGLWPTIKRPLEELQILITIEKLMVNLAISDDKFELKTPEAATIQKLD